MNPAVIGAMVRLRMMQLARDRMGLVWLLVMPMVFSFLMGELMGDFSGPRSGPAPRFMVYDRDGGVSADNLLAPLRGNDRFRLVRVDSVVAPDAAQKSVADGEHAAALIIPPGYSDDLAAGRPVELALWFDSDRLSSQSVNTLLDRSVLRLNTMRAAEQLVMPEGAVDQPLARDRAATFDRDLFDGRWENPQLTLAPRTLGRLQDDDWGLTDAHQHVGPAYVLFFVMMFLLLTAKDLVAARQDRTLARLVMSRATSTDLVLGFFAGGMAIGLVQATILLVLNSLAFGLDYGDSVLGLVLVVFLFAGFSSGAAVLLGSLARTGAQADGLGMALTMTMAALGGLWWPLEVVPKFMQDLGHGLPTGQAITAFHDMIGRGYGVPELGGLLTGLAVWFMLALVLGAWRLRRLLSA
jgi:ABC-2 type transport system permease protein